jgi:glycerol-3-phosphate acyltransferase PlsY
MGLIISLYLYKKDVRKEGSGNIGATNVFRVLGPLPGLLTLIGDMFKGAFPSYLATLIFPNYRLNELFSLWVVCIALAAIVGHSASIYLKFKGGKSVATAAGALLVLFPRIVLILFLVFLSILFLFRYVSLSSISVAILFPILMYLFYPHNFIFLIFAILSSSLVVIRHRENIKRLLRGEEGKIK